MNPSSSSSSAPSTLQRQIMAPANRPGDIELNNVGNMGVLNKLMECPICYDICIPPVTVCVTGHQICGTCSKKLKNCAMCLKKFEGGRNFFYENFFDNSTFCCRFANEGCKEKILGTNLKTHLETCKFRAFICQFCTSPTRTPIEIQYLQFQEHIKLHFDDPKTITCHINNLPLKSSYTKILPVTVVKARDFQNFTIFPILLVLMDYEVRKVITGIFVFIIGDQDDANKFMAKIHVNPKSNASPFEWEEQIHSVRSDWKTVINNEKYYYQENLQMVNKRNQTGQGRISADDISYEIFPV